MRQSTEIKEASRLSFDRQAAAYDEAVYGGHARKLYAPILGALDGVPHRRLLDLGCGTGELLKILLELGGNTACTGLDLSENMLAVARKKLGERAQLVRGDAERLPFGDGSFDAVVCNDSFHHYPDPAAVVAEVERVLRPGGTFVLGDCRHAWPGRALINLFLRFSRGGDVKIYAEREIRALLSARFGAVDYRVVNAHAFLATGKKQR